MPGVAVPAPSEWPLSTTSTSVWSAPIRAVGTTLSRSRPLKSNDVRYVYWPGATPAVGSERGLIQRLAVPCCHAVGSGFATYADPPPAGPRYAAPPQNYPPAPSYEERGYSQPPAAADGYGAPTPLYPGAGRPGPGAPPRTLGTIPQGPVPSAEPAEVEPQTPQGQYQAAYALIGQGQFGAAQQAFQAFIQQYPRDPLASSAAYWIGHSYYARGDFQNAAVAYADAYKKYPKGNKAPETLLDLGRSLARLDQVPSACATFAQFDKQFGPGAAPQIKRQVEQERARLRCN